MVYDSNISHYIMLSKIVNYGSTTIVTCNANYTPWNLLLYPCVLTIQANSCLVDTRIIRTPAKSV